MSDALIAAILDEGKWLTASMTVAFVGVALLLVRRRGTAGSTTLLVAAAMSLFFALTIGTMAFGHLLAVSTKLALGTLPRPPFVLYAIGLALALPAWWLAYHAPSLVLSAQAARRAIVLNVWTGATLLILGVPNAPLALPALLNVVYLSQSRPLVRFAVVAMAVVVNAGLFIGSLILLASGQSFEQFRGMQ